MSSRVKDARDATAQATRTGRAKVAVGIFLSMLAVLTLGATTAAADTLSIEVSPSSTTGDQPLQLTASGSNGDLVRRVVEITPQSFPGSPAPCPAAAPEYNEGLISLLGSGTIPFTLSFYAPFERGLYRLCGYGPNGTIAETLLTVTADPLEVKEAAERKAREEQATDTFWIEVSPTHVIGRAQVQLTTRLVEHGPPNGRMVDASWGVVDEASCPYSWEKLLQGRHYAAGGERTVPYVASFTAPEQAGVYSLCGYAAGFTVARAPLTVTASPEEAARAAAEGRAHKTRVTRLSVRTVAHPGRSSQDPGYTDLIVITDSYAHVTVKLTRYGHRTERFNAAPRAPTSRLAIADVFIGWTCSRPGGAYRYVVTARSDVGPTLTRRGHFSPVSVARCQMLKRHEREARERSERTYAEEVRRRAREEREAVERYEGNCRAEGGTPITLHTSEGPERACRAPGGGLLSVPE
jgi:hypothetical protein